MVIYFVSKFSKLKSPFDITDENGDRIIHVGDICLKENDEGLRLFLVSSSDDKWNNCIYYAKGAHLSLDANTLVFSFDGLHPRKGNPLIISELREIIKEEPYNKIFAVANNILSFQEDFWDATIFCNIVRIQNRYINNENQIVEKEDSFPTLFAKYLNQKSQDIFLDMYYNKGEKLRSIYLVIKEKYPNEFSSSMMTFLKENEGKSIYDVS